MFRFGPIEVRPATRELYKHGMRVKLPPQAFEVLRVLLERKGELVTRQEFHRALWSADTFVDFDQGLNNAIKRIREILNDSAESPRFIETLPRLGYRFIGELNLGQPDLPQPSPAGDPLPALESPGSVERLSGEQPSGTPATLRPNSRALSLFVATSAVGVLVFAFFLRPHYSDPRITGVVQLTADGAPKWGPLATDGLRIYVTEVVNGQQMIAAVPITGGQPVPLKLPFSQAGLYGISPGKSDLLVAEADNMFREAPLWRVPIIGGTPRRLGSVAAHDASWSPDDTRLAYVVGSGLYVANADGSNPREVLAPTGVPDEWAWHPAWSPDSRRLRFGYYNMETHRSQIWEVDADGSHPHAVFTASADMLMQAFGDWTPDGRYYVFSSWKEIESGIPWPAANLFAIREKADFFHRRSALPANLTTGPIRYFVHVFSSDGKKLFALSSLKHGELTRYDTHTKRMSLYASGISAEGVSFSRDGEWIAYVKYPQGELWRSRTDGSEPLQLSARPLFASTPAWSPDGKQIAFNGTLVGERSHSYLVPVDGGEPRRIDKIGEGTDPNWSPDGSSLVFMDDDHDNGGIKVLNLKTGTLTAVEASRSLMVPRMSPDGNWIVALSQNLQKLFLFDVRTRAWRQIAQAGSIEWPIWSRDSRSIYFQQTDPGPEIVRLAVEGGTPEPILSLKDFHATGVDPKWFSLTARGDILLLRDTGGGTEIYALSWDAP